MFKKITKKLGLLVAMLLFVPSILGACTLFNNDDNTDEVVAVSITADTSGAKLLYTMGESFTENGLIVYLNYSDQTRQDVTNSANINSESFNAQAAGTYDVLISYQNFNTSYSVQVSNTYTAEDVISLYETSYALFKQSNAFGYLSVDNDQISTYYGILTPFYNPAYLYGESSVAYESEQQIEDLYNSLFAGILYASPFYDTAEELLGIRDGAVGLLDNDFDEMVTYCASAFDEQNPMNDYISRSAYMILGSYIMLAETLANDSATYTILNQDGMYYVNIVSETTIEQQVVNTSVSIYFDSSKIIRNINVLTTVNEISVNEYLMFNYGDVEPTINQADVTLFEEIAQATFAEMMSTQSIAAISQLSYPNMNDVYFINAFKVTQDTMYSAEEFIILSSGETFDTAYYVENLFNLDNEITLENLSQAEIDALRLAVNYALTLNYSDLLSMVNSEDSYIGQLVSAIFAIYNAGIIQSLNPSLEKTITETDTTITVSVMISDLVQSSITYNKTTKVLVSYDLYDYLNGSASHYTVYFD